MKTYSLKELQFHLRRCKKCQLTHNLQKTCEKIRKYAQQDYIRQKEQAVEPQKLARLLVKSWQPYVTGTVDYSLQEQVTEILQLLDPEDQKIIKLHFWKGRTLREITVLLGFKSHNSIRKRLKRAYKILEACLTTKNENHEQLQSDARKSAQKASTERENYHEK